MSGLSWCGVQSFRAYKGTCFILYLISAVGAIPDWVFEISSVSPQSTASATRPVFPLSIGYAMVDLLHVVTHDFDFETLIVLCVNGLALFASLHFPPRPNPNSAAAAGASITVASTPRGTLIVTPRVAQPKLSTTTVTARRIGVESSPSLPPKTTTQPSPSLVASSPSLSGAGLPMELHISLFSLHSLPSLLCGSLALVLGVMGRSALIWLPLLTALVVLTLLLPQSIHALFHHIIPVGLWKRRAHQLIDRARRNTPIPGSRTLPPSGDSSAKNGVPRPPTLSNGLGGGGSDDSQRIPTTAASDSTSPTDHSPHGDGDSHSHSHAHSPHTGGGGDECCPMSPELVHAPALPHPDDPLPQLSL